ncbi:phosphatidate phosphatase APP1 [Sagittula marina]|uniref:Phosphatidate phosphatase APP1 n=1 Tax=Sagittula marina TaxID=943940 RepID=A0A7W6DQB2_9RHOB|nr:phosphatase domain-containing protein [Sagittula marina]MBB3984795.1 phosphatidate phosphatase APP1 [Sagittula marina]
MANSTGTFSAGLNRAARAVEGLIERAIRSDAPPMLKAYRGYAVPGGLVIQGRVVSAVRRAAPEADQSKWVNFKQMVSLFLTSEVRGVPVVAAGVEGRSDAEGYIQMKVPRAPDHAGWVHIEAEIAGSDDAPKPMPVLVPQAEARYGVVSDIDDTMLHTGAFSLPRNLWNTFTGNALTREVYPDAVKLMARLSEGGRNPVYYVSSSPWNLFAFLEGIFDRAGLVQGPMFLRDLGVSDKGLIGASHGDHKGAAIDRILAANPELQIWLLGDTGQKDAIVYRDAVARNPGRIGGVVLREATGTLPEAARAAVTDIEAAGVPCAVVADFDAVPETVLPAPLDTQG